MDRDYRILHVIYHALVGFNTGFVCALLAAQWTWLELRANTGMLILFGCLAGAGYGLFRRRLRRPLIVGGGSVLAVVCTSLIITRGDFTAARILSGVIFREGMLMPDLTLGAAGGLTTGLGLLTLLLSWVYYRVHGAGSQRPRHERHEIEKD